MSLPQDIKAINKMLEKHHGKAFNNKPWYRIAWSESMTEKRIGAFSMMDLTSGRGGYSRSWYSLITRKFGTHSIRVPMNLSGCSEVKEESIKGPITRP
jgi:hypothetical protein